MIGSVKPGQILTITYLDHRASGQPNNRVVEPSRAVLINEQPTNQPLTYHYAGEELISATYT